MTVSPQIARTDAAGDAQDEPSDLAAWLAQLRDVPPINSPLTARQPNVPASLGGFLNSRAEDLQRQILRDGVSYHVVSEGTASQRPWALGLLPWVLSADAWRDIEVAVQQRARLLQWLAADLYGEQRCVRDGTIPWPLIARHPGFLRPMCGVRPVAGLWLSVVAFDLARDDQGRWCVLTQRCQAPSGLGYALHNRVRVGELFPQAFESLRIQRLASTYRHLLDSLQVRAASLSGSEAPTLALLTPGPYSETYFEQVYLARYLGLPLVEGNDLCVQDQTLFLKTVQGLQRVHGLLRRVDDDWCDPLELRADSQLGVPGLIQVLRAGRLVMSNTPGCGVLETPALHGFLPRLCQQVLGEELALPSVDSWWCGEAAALDDLRLHGEDILWRSSYPERGITSNVLRRSTDLPEGLEDDPAAFTAQRPIAYWRAPLWTEGQLHHRPALLRVLGVADASGQWHVLPGGMARVAPDERNHVSMQRGGISMDTWVQTEGEVDRYSMLSPQRTTRAAHDPARPVTSRTAENLFWLGRYTERAEQGLQLVRQNLAALDARSEVPLPVRDALARCAQRAGLLPAGSPLPSQSPRIVERNLMQGLLLARPQLGLYGLAFNLQALAQASQSLRERLSSEHVRWIEAAWGLVAPWQQAGDASSFSRARARTLLDELSLHLAALTGAQSDRMTRDHGWRFLTLGRLLERLIGTGASLDQLLCAGALDDEAGLDALLQLFDSAITYRARYQRRCDAMALADVLVLDDRNPRALAGNLRRMRTEWQKLPDSRVFEAEWTTGPMRAGGLQVGSVATAAPSLTPGELASWARALGQEGARLAQSLGDVYFSPAHNVPQAV
jgi:uncharacterized circularly permuted ATP-grasp superfamily protein/uncharacterized alpha-E superfamily protein